MAMREFSQGETIYEAGQKIDALYMIIRGTASASYLGGKHILKTGDIIGICEVNGASAFMNYKAEEKLSVHVYPYQNGDLTSLFETGGDVDKYFRASFFRQFNMILSQYKLLKNECNGLYDYFTGSYQDYVSLCEKYSISPGAPANYEELSRPAMEEDVPTWISGYYSTLEQMMTTWDYNVTDHDFECGFLQRASWDIHSIVYTSKEMLKYRKDICGYLVNENGLDLLELMAGLYGRMVRVTGTEGEDAVRLLRSMNDVLRQLEQRGYAEHEFFRARKKEISMQAELLEKRYAQKETAEEQEQNLTAELSGSLEKILAFVGCEAELSDAFRKHIQEYKKTNNKNGTEDDIRLLRQQITKEFNKLYTEAFLKSVNEPVIPIVVKMFFNFGYVDEELAGMENATYLYRVADHLPTAPDRGIYSFYEWLMAIYNGYKEPSRNEFDMDFTGYLQEQKRNGKITAEEVTKLLHDNTAKVMYELENVFPSVNKVSFGRISTFCPVFAEHHVIKSLDSALVSEEKIEDIITNIRKKDYGAYYRETLYSNPDQGVAREFINVEVLPDVILTPNVGTRGIMWQEIEGKRRTTPARMMMSVFQLEDLALIFIRLTAEFRWEMCKRIQGARWNDVSERSLTSEYFDYIQFYRKNNDLSTEAKDKIKTDLIRAKNSFKEMFVMDYTQWILFESNGAPRLNRVARAILFNYCPFAKEVREKLKANPMYKEIVERYEMHTGQKKHRLDNLCQKLRTLGKPIPKEIEREAEYLNM